MYQPWFFTFFETNCKSHLFIRFYLRVSHVRTSRYYPKHRVKYFFGIYPFVVVKETVKFTWDMVRKGSNCLLAKQGLMVRTSCIVALLHLKGCAMHCNLFVNFDIEKKQYVACF